MQEAFPVHRVTYFWKSIAVARTGQLQRTSCYFSLGRQVVVQ
jgi:hypothetical protein